MANEVDNILQDVGVAEVIVKLKDDAPMPAGARLALGASLAIRAMPDLMSLFISRAEIGNPLAATSRRGANLALASRGGETSLALASRGVAAKDVVATLFPRLGLAVGLVNQAAADALRAHPQVESINPAPTPSLIRPVRAATAAPKQTTWGITKLNVPNLWNRGLIGTGVVVGHLDTGVDGSHPALATAIDSFVEFDLTGKPVPGAKAHDSDVHGTHTAGTIAGRGVNGRSFGVAPGAKLASALVIEGGDVVTRILGGMEWIAGKKVRILSMSLGIRGYDTTFKVIVDALRKNDILPIFAVGNEGVNTSRYPGNYDNVVSVGAFGADGTIGSFSSSQSFARPSNPTVPYLAGPGVDVISCVPGGGYESMDGTSMATPHIAGLAALLLQARPAATLAQLEAAIMHSCARLPGMTADRAGQGVPDAVQALTAILAGAPAPQLAAYVPRGAKAAAARRKPKAPKARKSVAARKKPKPAKKKAAKTKKKKTKK